MNASIAHDTYGRDESLILGLFDGVGSDDEIAQLMSIARLGEDVDPAMPRLRVGSALSAALVEGRTKITPDDSLYEDYTAEEWAIVLELRSVCQDATRQAINKNKAARAIAWLFVPHHAGRKGARFVACCEALSTRPWVVLSLVQHLWYLRDMPVGPLPDGAMQLPEPLESEAILKGWEAGLRMAALTWLVPGVEFARAITAVVDAGVPHADAVRATDALIECGLLGQRGTRLYFTSRPSHIRRTGRVGWAKSFVA